MSLALRPGSLDEAMDLLREDPGILPVAGGTDLMVCEALERASMDRVVSVLEIPELRGISEGDGGVEIGAATTFSEIGASPLVHERFPALAQAAGVVGGWQIQNRATLGGNIANASPAGDSLPVLLALDATVVCAGPEGRREISYSEFHTGYRATALKEGEILIRIHLPFPPAGSHQGFRKIGTREAQAISKVVLGLWARVDDGKITEARLGAGSVAAVPIRLRRTEEALRGLAPGLEAADLAGRTAAEETRPIDDVRSTAAYRSFALERVVRRMVLEIE